MIRDHVERFLCDVEKRGIEVTKADRALLLCFLQWYHVDLMTTDVERKTNG